MGSFVSKKTHKVTVPDRPAEWIEIRAKLSVGARGQLTDSIMSVSAGKGGEAEIAMRAGQYLAAMLEAAVVDWCLLDDEDQPVKFKRALIAELDPDDALVDAALAEITARNPTLGGKPPPKDTPAG